MNFLKNLILDKTTENTEAFKNKVTKSTFNNINKNNIIGYANTILESKESNSGIKLGSNKIPIEPKTIVVTN